MASYSGGLRLKDFLELRVDFEIKKCKPQQVSEMHVKLSSKRNFDVSMAFSLLYLTKCLPLSSAENFCNQFGPRSDLTFCPN